MILSLLVKALAKRSALNTASVPEFTNRTLSIPGKESQTILAILSSPLEVAPKV